MPRPTWATDEQTAWLKARLKDFTDAQAESNSKAFLSATTEAFLQKWPPLAPTEAELAEYKNDEDAYYEAGAARTRNRVEWWFRNRARTPGSGTGRGANTTNAVLDLTRRRPQRISPYQAYMHLFSDRVMSTIKENYEEYKSNLPAGETPREQWGWSITEAQRLLAIEPMAIKAAVEAYRELHAQSPNQHVFDIAELMNEGREVAQQRTQALQERINRLARTAFEACKSIEEQTGWKATMFLGGPNPETGRMTTLAVHNGRTRELHNLFSEATEKWSVIQAEWDSFVARCYRPDDTERLERAYRGELRDDDFPAAPAAGAEDQTNAGAGAGPSSDSTITSATPNTLPVRSEHSAPDVTPVNASGPGQTDPLAFERARLARMAQNQVILQQIVGGDRMADIRVSLQLSADESSVPKGQDTTPEWIGPAYEYLKGVGTDAQWLALVEAWMLFEQALGFPESSAQSNWLSPKMRPEEAKHWLGRGRKYDKPPKIKSLPTFVGQFCKWWARLQPHDRRDPEEPWPLLKNVPEDEDSWSDLRRGGSNGMFMVLMCLSWWYITLNGDDTEDGEVFEVFHEAVDDVYWVITTIVPSAKSDSGKIAPNSDAPTNSGEPASSESSTGTTNTPSAPSAPSTPSAPSAPSAGTTTTTPAPSAGTTTAPSAATAGIATTAPSPSTASAGTATTSPSAPSPSAPTPSSATSQEAGVISSTVAPTAPLTAAASATKRPSPEDGDGEAPAPKKQQLTADSAKA